jgi:hypothetical protein
MQAQASEPFASRVDFAYSFATPHRMTVARPNSRDKTLLDAQAGHLRMAWTYEDLTTLPLFAFATPTTRWELQITPRLDGQAFARSSWARLEGFLPALHNTYVDGRGELTLDVVGSDVAAVTRVSVTNRADKPHQFRLSCEKPGQWAGMNPAWVDAQAPAHFLLAGWLDRADRVLVLGLGADEYPVSGPTQINMLWTVAPGETRTGWLIRPYRAYAEDVAQLEATDWAVAFEQALGEWRTLLGQATQVQIPDPGVRNGFYACLGDLFIMREPLADGQIVGTPGTEGYRAPNSYEAGIMAVALDQVNLHDEAERGYGIPLTIQEPDGDWTEPRGWAHLMWGGAGFKSWVVMEHYHLTQDREYLAQQYPRMAASTRWQERMRARTRTPQARQTMTYGLMPRGMGDCGLKDGDDLYGVFTPHNIWSVYADKLTLQAAQLLGKADDIPELQRIYESARQDLLAAIDAGAIGADGYRWIPGVPGKTSGSRWGVLNALFPTGLLAPDDPLIEGTLRYIESNQSPGGIPVNTGWMTDGMWVAITLDNIAEAHLARGEGDAAAEYLYAVLNHGTPLYTWCEERGQAAGTEKTSGDRQHLWTPVAVVRATRDCFVMEQGHDLHLGLGLPREWLGSGQPVGVERAPTYWGLVSYSLQYDATTQRVHVWIASNDPPKNVILHVRLPRSLKVSRIEGVPGESGAVCADGQSVQWAGLSGECHCELLVE